MNNTKVLLIDAHEISREGLKLLLHSDSYDVVGAIRSLEEARTAIAEGLRPDLVLFVLEHLGESAVALQQIRAGFSAFKFVIITAGGPPSLSPRFIQTGANGGLLGNMSPNAPKHSPLPTILAHEKCPPARR